MTVQEARAFADDGGLLGDRWHGRAFTGAWEALGRAVEVREPATGARLGEIAVAAPEDVARSSAAARAAQAAWFALPYDERSEVMRKAAEITEARFSEIVDWIVRESGSIPAKAEYELAVTIKMLRICSAMPREAQGQVLPAEAGRLSIARRRPLGVVGVIAPFNFPLYLAIRAVAPALAVGNAVVLKPDTRTAVCGGVVIARIFEEAGLPAGVLHVLPGEADAGAAMCSDPNVAMIQFTGSTEAGRKVGELAGKHLKKVSLELGGKNATIVLDDADIALAVKNAKWGAYLHQGQICMASGRILVQRSIAEALTAALAAGTEHLPVGDPASGAVALGPMIGAGQVAQALAVLDAAVAEGATIRAGGTADGLFFKPTVLADVTPGMRAYREEIFAPVAVVTVFDTDEEAIELANAGDFGLSAGIPTNSIERALAIADRLEVGLLHINDQTVNEEVVNPFGGTIGGSGNGVSIGGPANWEAFTHWQWLTLKGRPPAYPL